MTKLSSKAAAGPTRLLGAFALVALTAGAAFAQAQRPAQTPSTTPQTPTAQEPLTPRQVTGTTTGWTKLCQRLEGSNPPRDGCIIAQEVRQDNGTFLASLALQEVQGENRRQLIIAVPLGMALQAGLLFRIDQQRALPSKYGTCVANGCLAGIDIGPEVLQQMRTGQNAFITVRNAAGNALDLTVPLATFARAYDGPATDAGAVVEQQRRLEQELGRRAEEQRRALEQQQQPQQPPRQ
jgi:invasion protein IalB